MIERASRRREKLMGFEFLVIVGTIFMLPFVAAGFVVFWTMNHHDRALIEGVWEGYAARRVREFVPARGEWPNRSSPAVRWRKGGVRFELSLAGREAVASTRLAVWPRERLIGSFVVTSRKALLDAAPESSFDAFFERSFAIAEKPARLAARVLDDASRRALLGFSNRDRVELRYQRGQLRLEWAGRESNDARIDEAEGVLLALTRSFDVTLDEAPPIAVTAEPR